MSKKKREAIITGLNINGADTESANNQPDLSSPAIQSTQKIQTIQKDWKNRLVYPIAGIALVALLGIGVMAKNGWLPHTDSFSGKKTGWFGKEIKTDTAAKNSSSSSTSLFSSMLPDPTPAPQQLSKEYIYAGSRMLAVEDANASASAPSDIAVWRPSDGTWYILNASNGQTSGGTFGQSGDKPRQGDYDGDGKTDFCVTRNENGNKVWYVLPSSGASFYGIQFGLDSTAPGQGDVPAEADYDGDGRTDIGVYRSGNWYILRSSDNGITSIGWGVGGAYLPVPKDYDGDGKADLALWDASAHLIYVMRSSDWTYQTSPAIGTITDDKPVPADYDGDGKCDYAVKSGTSWIINKSSTGVTETISWQPDSTMSQTADIAVQNDYDGDGKVDVAVWRPANGKWYIRQSSLVGQTNELRTETWGASTDIPVPSYYRR